MQLQSLRQAASQGTISLPPPRDSEILEDVGVLKLCLDLSRKIGNFREAFALNPNRDTVGKLMLIVEAREQLSHSGKIISLKDYFYSDILPTTEDLDLLRMESYVNACLDAFDLGLAEHLSIETFIKVANQFAVDGINWRRSTEDLQEAPFIPKEDIPSGERLGAQIKLWEAYSQSQRDMDPYVHLILTILYFVALSPLNKHNERIGQILYQIGLLSPNIESPFPCIQLGKALRSNPHLGIEERLYGLRTQQWFPYLKFSLRTLVKAFEFSLDLIKAIERLENQTQQYLEQLELSSHVPFLPAIFACPACRTGEFSSISGTRRQVASHILNDLSRADILERLEDGRDKIFFNKRLIELLESPYYSFSPFKHDPTPFVPLYQKGVTGKSKIAPKPIE